MVQDGYNAGSEFSYLLSKAQKLGTVGTLPMSLTHSGQANPSAAGQCGRVPCAHPRRQPSAALQPARCPGEQPYKPWQALDNAQRMIQNSRHRASGVCEVQRA